MESKIMATSILLLVITTLITSPIGAAAIIEEPHVDPNRVEEGLDPISLVIIYINIIRELSDLDINSSIGGLRVLKNASVPYDVHLIMMKLNELIGSLAELLNNTVYELNRAEEYIDDKRIMEANESLNRASLYLFKANITLQELLSAWYEFKQRLSSYVVREYRPRFLEYAVELELLFKRLNELLDKLNTLRQDLQAEVETLLIVNPAKLNTSIRLYYYNKTVYPGGRIVLKGVLKDEYMNPIPNRPIKIWMYLGEKRIIDEKVLTDSQGLFGINITLPEMYYLWRAMKPGIVKFNATMYVLFTPSQEDNYSKSYTKINITYYYYRSKLDVIGVTKAYVGSNLTYRVRILPANAANNRELLVFLDGENVENITLVTANDYREIDIEIPSNISIGQHSLNITLRGYREFSPDSVEIPIIVQHIPIYVSVEYPRNIIYPLQQLHISGSITDLHGKPIANAAIIVGDIRTYSDYEGRFNITVPLESISVIGGSITINITIKPSQPWYPVVNKSLRIGYLNLFSIAGIVSYIVVVIMVAPLMTRYSIVGNITLGRKIKGIEKIIKHNISHRKSLNKKGIDIQSYNVRSIKENISEQTIEVLERDIRELVRLRMDYNIREDDVITKFTKMLVVLSNKYSNPLPFETLREYINRIGDMLPHNIYNKILNIISLVEKDLFSKTGLSDHERRLAVNLIDEVVRYVRRV